MDIVIPTYGRSGDQQTLRQLFYADLNPTLVVQAREYAEYAKYAIEGVTVVQLPHDITTIAPTRQWIMENVGVHDHICMLDDDLVFYKRRDDDKTKLRDIEPEELYRAFVTMDTWLRDYPHVGFASREGANRNTDDWQFNTRIMRVLGYNRVVLRNEGIRFDRMEVMEDFDVALQLLEAGHNNVILNKYAHNQSGSGAEGGCSHFRTPELHAANAQKLAELHPGFVTVVDKVTKTAWGGGTRKDVRIQWKRARGE